MNHTFKYYSFLFLIIILGCRKDEITPIFGEGPLTPSENVSFLIQIIDEKNNGIANAIVAVKDISQPFTTDKNGFVSIKNVSVPKTGLLTTVAADFYHKQIKLLTGVSNSKNTRFFKMVGNRNFHTMTTGSESGISHGGKLTLPQTLLLPDGGSYQGMVKVINDYFDPDDKEFLLSAPGNMLAIDTNGNYKTLASLGMYRIELYTEAGQPLKIKAGDKATLFFPVAEVHKGQVPESIPLWTLNEDNGFWVSEGEANLEGDYMVAKVSHFSFWNCDLPFEFEEICFTVKTQDGLPIPGLNLSFYADQNFCFGYDQTNDSGVVCGRIALGVPIRIEVLASTTLLQVFDVGPFSANSANIDLILTNKLVEVRGKAITCEMIALINGYGFAINANGGYLYQSFFYTGDGSFSYFTTTTDQILTLVDLTNNKTKSSNIKAEQLENNVDLGVLSVCEGSLESKISGSVWIDQDEDGLSDVPLEFAKVIVSGTNLYKELDTDQNGEYSLVVLPGAYNVYYFDASLVSYSPIASGDLSQDGTNNEIDAGTLMPGSAILCIVDPNEHDANNDFQVSPKGFGTVTGKVMVDMDNDGIGDKTVQGITINYDDFIVATGVTDENGRFNSGNMTQNYLGKLSLYEDQTWFYHVKSIDESEDGDGSTINIGFIPIRLKSNETDADNNFTIATYKSQVICRVLEDVNNDGIGDNPVGSQRVELYHRNAGGLPETPKLGGEMTNKQGYVSFHDIDPGEYVLYYIGNGEYTSQKGIDLIPNNNPVNPTGNNQFLSVDIIGKEYDDGNTFIVKKN